MKSESSVYQAIRRFWKQSIQDSQRDFSFMEAVVRTQSESRIPVSLTQNRQMEQMRSSISSNYKMLNVFQADDREKEEVEQERIRKEKDSYD